MKKCIIISDSFKGTLSSGEICAIARESVARIFPECEAVAIPVADGGEGTVDCFREACRGTSVTVTVQGPYDDPVKATYVRLDGNRAVIEMASSAGLPMVGERKDPCKTSTYGVGQQIRHAVEHGCTEIVLGLGGSCTNDGGCGCAAALGVCFTDREGREFLPVGGTLDQICGIDVSAARQLLSGVRLTGMCDIDNSMHGTMGAAYVFSPQKGANADMVQFLDRQLIALDQAIQRNLGCCVADIPGSGAAGALGAGVIAFLGGELRPGIETVLDVVGFDALMTGCDMVFTGEGRLDTQSIHGKAISGIARHAKRQGIPVIVIVGSVMPDVEEAPALEELGVSAIFSINRQAVDFSESRVNSRENYAYTFRNVLRLVRAAEVR